MNWARILAYVTGTVDQELLLRNEYLAAENRILKAKSKGRVRFSDAERARLGEIGHRLGCKVLSEVATVARPDTILAWYRKPPARSRHEIHPLVPSDHRIRASRTAGAACAQPEFECLCGALGPVGEGGVPVQGGSLR